MAAGIGIVAIIIVDGEPPQIPYGTNMRIGRRGVAEAVVVTVLPNPERYASGLIIGIDPPVTIVIISVAHFGYAGVDAAFLVVAIVARHPAAARAVRTAGVDVTVAILIHSPHGAAVAVLVMALVITDFGVSREAIRVAIVAIGSMPSSSDDIERARVVIP